MTVGTFTFYNESDLMVSQMETLLFLCDKIVIQSDSATPECLDIAEAYADNKNVFLIKNVKENNFQERDERGDRERLLVKAREIGGTTCLHTDVDEIVSTSSLGLVKNLLGEAGLVHCFFRYDLWENAHSYRLESSGRYKGMSGISPKPPCIYDYIFPILDGRSYGSAKIPNFHTPRIPFGAWTRRLNEDVKVIHYGYYRKSKIKQKETFYQTNPNTTGNIWQHDMQLDAETFRKEIGLGELQRK